MYQLLLYHRTDESRGLMYESLACVSRLMHSNVYSARRMGFLQAFTQWGRGMMEKEITLKDPICPEGGECRATYSGPVAAFTSIFVVYMYGHVQTGGCKQEWRKKEKHNINPRDIIL